ncbi:MAG: DUF2249 domain-containing protein [SAR324 cluster bacterium]|nr:DUF2249 domain-containing protein [SAR324 cluster bacterium]
MEHEILKTRQIALIDCREMLAPEPMIAVLAAVEKMNINEALLMQHRQKPVNLFPKLEDRGLQYYLEEESDGSIQLLIWQEAA